MRDKWKALWARRPRLSRKGKLARNLLFLTLSAVLILGLLDWPRLTLYGSFQKLEAAYLLTPSELVYRVNRGSGTAAFLTRGESWYALGAVHTMDGGASPLTRHLSILTHVLPADRLQVALVPIQGREGETAAVAVGLPEGAAAARLELTLEDIPLPWRYEVSEVFRRVSVVPSERFTAEGELLEEGCMRFLFPDHEDAHPDDQLCTLKAVYQDTNSWGAPPPLPCRLTVWDAQGRELLTWEGTTAEDAGLFPY